MENRDIVSLKKLGKNRMKKFIRKNKGVLWLCIVFIILFIGLIFIGLNVQKQQVLNVHKEMLRVLANEKAAQVNIYLESQKEKQEIISSVGVFKEVVKDPNNPIKIEAAKNRINELKDIIPGISILNNEGIVVIADIDLPGTDYGDQDYSEFLASGKILFDKYYDPLRKKDYYAVGGPIYDRIEKNKVIGAIGFDLELDKISTLMKETVDGGENDEVYLIDETGLLLSGSDYIDKDNKNGVLIQEIKSEGAKVCLEDLKEYGREGFVEEHEEEVFQYTNYIGDEVFGAHAYVPAIMGCVIAEKSADKITKLSMMDFIKNIFKKEVKDEA